MQRSQPLMDRIKRAEFFTNPPLVGELTDGRYVLMDGSNRHVSMNMLGFEHILVQVVDYESDFVELGVWQHIVADWDSQSLLAKLEAIDQVEIRDGWDGKRRGANLAARRPGILDTRGHWRLGGAKCDLAPGGGELS